MWVARLPTSIGPKTAVRITRPRTTAAAAATRSLTSRRNQTEVPLRRPVLVSASPTIAVVGLTGTRSICVMVCSSDPCRFADACIEQRVAGVDDDVENEDGDRRQQHGRLQYGEVALQDRVDHQLADARPAEDRFDDDRAVDQSDGQVAGDGQRGCG